MSKSTSYLCSKTIAKYILYLEYIYMDNFISY